MPLHTLREDLGFLYPEHDIMPFAVSHIPILTHKRLTVVLVLSHEEGEKMTPNNQIDGSLVRFHDSVCLILF